MHKPRIQKLNQELDDIKQQITALAWCWDMLDLSRMTDTKWLQDAPCKEGAFSKVLGSSRPEEQGEAIWGWHSSDLGSCQRIWFCFKNSHRCTYCRTNSMLPLSKKQQISVQTAHKELATTGDHASHCSDLLRLVRWTKKQCPWAWARPETWQLDWPVVSGRYRMMEVYINRRAHNTTRETAVWLEKELKQ